MSERIAGPRFAALLAVLLVPLYLWLGLGNRDVWAPDEPRFALVAREMQQRGNYALPTINGEMYAHKPPLLFWLISLASMVTGRDAVIEWLAEDISTSGATTRTSPNREATCASAAMPGL